MAASTWKLVVAALGGDGDAREVVVEGENWLTALRTAREALGEAGGVPPGASCVMNADGGVTILDGGARRRYELRPVIELGAPTSPEPASPEPALPEPAPETTSAAPTAESADEPEPVSPQPASADAGPALPPPSFQVSRPSNRPARATVAYASGRPSDPQAIAELGARPRSISPLPAGRAEPRASEAPEPDAAKSQDKARAAQAAQPAKPARPSSPSLKPVTQPSAPSASRPSRPARPSGASHVPTSAKARPSQAPSATNEPPGHFARPRSLTPALRDRVAVLGQVPRAAGAPPPAAPFPPLQPPPAASPPAQPETHDAPPTALSAPPMSPAQALVSPGLSPPVGAPPWSTEAPLAAASQPPPPAEARTARAAHGMLELVPFGGRDEDPRPQAPLSYRERSYYAAGSASDDDLEHALRVALAGIQAELASRARGQLINLAVFDLAFAGDAARGPIATLQWKDWRGEAVFARHTANQPAPPAPDPLHTSFVPPQWDSVPPAMAIIPPNVAFPAAVEPQYALTPLAPAAPAFVPAAPLPFAAAAPYVASSETALPPPTHPAPEVEASYAPGGHAPVAAQQNPARVPRATLGYVQTPVPPAIAQSESTGEQDQRLAQAFEATQDLYFLATPAAGLDFVIRLLAELVPSEASTASLYDITTDHFRCVAAAGQGAESRRAQAVSGSAGLLGVAARSRRDSLIVNDVRSDPRYIPGVDSFADVAAHGVAFFPLIVGVQLVGMLQLVNRAGRTTFSEADAAVGAYVASQAAKFVIDHRNMRDG